MEKQIKAEYEAESYEVAAIGEVVTDTGDVFTPPIQEEANSEEKEEVEEATEINEAEALVPLKQAAVQNHGGIPDAELERTTMICEYAAATPGMFPKDDFVSLLTKALLGRCLGITEMAAFTGIYTIRDQPSISSKLQRALAMRAGYQIRQIECTRNRCELTLVWRETGEVLGTAEFTAEEAEKAGLLKNDVWQKWRSDMLYNRCSSRLLDRFAANLEFGIDINDI